MLEESVGVGSTLDSGGVTATLVVVDEIYEGIVGPGSEVTV